MVRWVYVLACARRRCTCLERKMAVLAVWLGPRAFRYFLASCRFETTLIAAPVYMDLFVGGRRWPWKPRSAPDWTESPILPHLNAASDWGVVHSKGCSPRLGGRGSCEPHSSVPCRSTGTPSYRSGWIEARSGNRCWRGTSWSRWRLATPSEVLSVSRRSVLAVHDPSAPPAEDNVSIMTWHLG